MSRGFLDYFSSVLSRIIITRSLEKEDRMPFPKQPKHDFTLTAISTVRPNQSGIVGIFNHTHCIYVAQTDDLRENLLSHINRESSHATLIFEHDSQYWQAAVISKSKLD